MIYIEYQITTLKEDGHITKIDLNCEFHATESCGTFGLSNFPIKNSNIWTEQLWIDFSKFTKITPYIKINRAYAIPIINNELRKRKLNRICQE